MTLQTAVAFVQGLGVVGELFDNGPHRAQPFTIVSGSAANNKVGNAFTVTSEGVAAAGGTNSFGGFLVNPKEYASLGTTSGTLNPTLVLPNNALGMLLNEGQIIVPLLASAAIGDLVVFDTAGSTPGALSTISPGADLPVGKAYAHAFVTRFTVAAAGLAVIQVNNIPVTPVLA